MQYRSLSNKSDDEKTRLFGTVSMTMLPSQNGNSNIESTRGVDNVLQKAAETISVAGRRMKKNGASELSEPLTSFDLTSIGTDIERGEALIPSEDEDPYFVFRDDLIRRIASAEEALSDYVNAVERTVSDSSLSRFPLHHGLNLSAVHTESFGLDLFAH